MNLGGPCRQRVSGVWRRVRLERGFLLRTDCIEALAEGVGIMAADFIIGDIAPDATPRRCLRPARSSGVARGPAATSERHRRSTSGSEASSNCSECAFGTGFLDQIVGVLPVGQGHELQTMPRLQQRQRPHTPRASRLFARPRRHRSRAAASRSSARASGSAVRSARCPSGATASAKPACAMAMTSI